MKNRSKVPFVRCFPVFRGWFCPVSLLIVISHISPAMETIKAIFFRLQNVLPAPASVTASAPHQVLVGSNKNDFLWDEDLAELKDEWKLRGMDGVRRSMRELVHSTKWMGVSWDRARLDMALNRPTIIQYLYMMHPFFVDAVFAGEVTKRKYESKEMETILARYHTLDNFPGIYLNVLCRAENATSNEAKTKIGQWAGYNLRPSELRIVCNGIRRYLSQRDDASNKYAAKVDAAYGHMHDSDRPKSIEIPDGIDYSAGERRYAGNDDAKKTTLAWTEALEVRLAKVENDRRFWRTPLPQCFHEVGWGRNCQSRASKHKTHDGTNSLFGLVTAVVTHEFRGAFTIEQFQMARVTEPRDARLMEVYCSIIAGAYWFWGGLNPVLAGNVPMQGKTSALDPRIAELFTRNRQTIAAAGIYDISLKVNQEKRIRLKDWISMCESIQRLEIKVQGLRTTSKLAAGALEVFSDSTNSETTLAELRKAWEVLQNSLMIAGFHLENLEAVPLAKRPRLGEVPDS
jgi:hypothetical protein